MSSLANALAHVKQSTPVARTGGQASPALKVVSLTDLLAAGIPSSFIEAQMAVGTKLVDVSARWQAVLDRDAKAAVQPVRTVPVAPVVKAAPYVPPTPFVVPADADPALKAQLEALMAENGKLKAAKSAEFAKRALTVKVSQAGAVSVYGLGRFPVTLYKGQWEKLLSYADDISLFIMEHADVLKVKE